VVRWAYSGSEEVIGQNGKSEILGTLFGNGSCSTVGEMIRLEVEEACERVDKDGPARAESCDEEWKAIHARDGPL
jgi:hypothetical protein